MHRIRMAAAAIIAGSTLLAWGPTIGAAPTTGDAVAGGGAVSQGTLYFNRDDVSELYTLDTTDATATLIGTTGTTSDTVGLTEGPDDGVLIGSTWTDLSEINADGTGHTLAGVGDLRAEGLAFDPTSGILYRALNGEFTTADLTTGEPGPVDLDQPGEDIEGLAWRDDGNLYGLGTESDTLFAYDIAGDAWSEVGSTGITELSAFGLAWDSTIDVLYAVNGDGDLYGIDPDTAVSSLIGNTGLGEEGEGGGGLAFLADAPAAEATLVPGEPEGEAGGDVTFPVSGICGTAAGNEVVLTISGPDGAAEGPVEATTGADGTYEAELVVADAPAGTYTISGTCTIVGGPEVALTDATVVLGAAAEPPSEGPTAVPAAPSFTG